MFEAKWLAEEGKKCATLIDNLQGKYAQIGYERVGTILDRYQAYLDTMKGLSKFNEPWQTLATAWHAFATEVINSEQMSLDLSKQLLTLSQTVIDNRPELASPAHDPAIFPLVEGGDVWKDGDTWQPQNKPTPAPIV